MEIIKKMKVVILLGMIVMLSGWGEKEIVVKTINKNPAKVITHQTTGRINVNGVIGVRFSEDQVSPSDVRKYIKNNIFEFSPKIEGRVYWDDTKTIAFQPRYALPRNVKYVGTLKANLLFADIKNVSSNTAVIEVETAWNRIADFDGEFMQVKNSKDKMIYKGKIQFTEDVKIEDVKKSVKFKDWLFEKKINFISIDKKTYEFTSEVVERKTTEKKYQIIIKKDGLGMFEDFKQDIATAPVGKMTVMGTAEELYLGQSSVKVTFSDKLDELKNYSGFIKIEPSVQVKVKAIENTLSIYGNFEKGKNYKVTILNGMKSLSGNIMVQKYEFYNVMQLADMNPKLEFVSNGVFLPSAKNKKIEFRTLNVERVFLKLKRVSENNLINFLNDNDIAPSDSDYSKYNTFKFRRVGEIVDAKMLYIGKDKNKWIQSEIDLSKVLNKNSQGLYVLQLEYNEDDALFFSDDMEDWRRSDYIYENGTTVKHIIVSDIGVSAKISNSKVFVAVNDIITTKPIPMAVVKLKNSANQVLGIAMTDNDGMAEISGVRASKSYIEVNYMNQFSILKLSDSELSNSLFDVGGTTVENGIKIFAYKDRGVYRPGDDINLSVIVRNEFNSFPENHPVTLKVYNPKENVAVEMVNKVAKDGFYSFNFKTKPSDMTGNWKIKVFAGNSKYIGDLKIEEIVPYRIKVNIQSDKEELTLEDRVVNFKINTKYLFGAPASNLDTTSKIVVEPFEVKFDRFKKYIFNNDSMDFQKVRSEEIVKKLDADGNADIEWNIPEITDIPSALRLNITTKVMETGGRMVPKSYSVPYKVYDRYVGIEELPNMEIETGSKAKFNIILVSSKGELTPGVRLNYKIYRMNKYWWWEYDDADTYRTHFKTDSSTVMKYSGTITSGERPVSLEFAPSDYGEMLVEVEDPEGGHKAGYFFRSYWWGASQTGKGADTLNIKTDKPKYVPGETVKIITKTPDKGRALITVVKGEKIVYKKWEELKSNNSEFRIPVTANMVPNAYANISVFQPYEQTTNDLPLRLYGIVPIMVENKNSHLNFSLIAPDAIKPQTDFDVEIQTDDRSKAQFTLAIVDNGLLDITDFITPAPWFWFYKKEGLLFRNYDIYSDIIRIEKMKSSKVFSVGGDGDVEEDGFRKKDLSKDNSKRFKPVALFKGPFMTDERGHAKLTFTMPDYNGSVRVMAIGAQGAKYGSKDKDIAVKAALIVMPTLPRVLGTQDKIVVPVQVFSTEGEKGAVKVSIETTGPVKVVNEPIKEVILGEKGSTEVLFNLEASDAIGDAKIIIKAVTEKAKAVNETDMIVRPYNNYTYLTDSKVINTKKSAKFRVPEKGIGGTNSAKLALSLRKDVNLETRIKWLIKYPYGCIEQTTSSVMPQMLLKTISELTDKQIVEIDKNVNEGIKRIMKFQTQSGGFSYWPGGSEADDWGTNYAGHFLIEAQKSGYYVPEDLMNKWTEYQNERARTDEGSYLERTYRLYLLALEGKPAANAMNILKENHIKQLGNAEKYLLAGAYKLAGFDSVAQGIIDTATLEIKDYSELSGSYGSAMRDKGIILEVLTLLGKTDAGLPLYNEIAANISSDKWYSTQTLGYSLLALAKYIEETEKQKQEIDIKIAFGNGEEMKFKSKKSVASVDLDKHLGEEITVINNGDAPIYSTVNWEGIPVKDVSENEAKNITVTAEWLDENGNKIDPTVLEQGRTIWGHFMVKANKSEELANIALCQIIPSGWEIENTRLSGEPMPEWSKKYNLGMEEFLDIRDDRVMWFFDMEYGNHCDFMVKINTVTAGEFYLSSTVAEAMYDNRYKSVVKGMNVTVKRKENK